MVVFGLRVGRREVSLPSLGGSGESWSGGLDLPVCWVDLMGFERDLGNDPGNPFSGRKIDSTFQSLDFEDLGRNSYLG